MDVLDLVGITQITAFCADKDSPKCSDARRNDGGRTVPVYLKTNTTGLVAISVFTLAVGRRSTVQGSNRRRGPPGIHADEWRFGACRAVVKHIIPAGIADPGIPGRHP